ncbi:hypothetical protein MAGR_20830 [Mycolicibacterium agri]|uniref:NHL repeat-containing protein n=1 Tax=Mycolicibacterium agri TaxID=36811 RepID=A0A7I9VYV7_MYCAG|nr:hypothetical protein MAGR_20830 [Mycolicibacterium agri]
MTVRTSVEPNAGRDCSADTLYWPFGIALIGSRFWIADTGNRRVLGWQNGIPEPGQPADIVLGQPDPAHREENRGGAVNASSFRWPHALAGHQDLLLVADGGDHRVLGWSPQPVTDRPADLLLGQPDFATAQEWPYAPQQADRFRFPYSVALQQSDAGAQIMAVADTANNRVLLWDGVPTDGRGADVVLAQPTFAANGENRWSAVEPDTLCWPYGVCLSNDLLAVADSGNNRVVLWGRS